MIIADDFGLDKDTTKAQLILAKKNKIDGVSVLVYSVADSDIVDLINTGTQIGLHLDLIETGSYPWSSVEKLLLSDSNLIEKEILFQMNLFHLKFGRMPAFIDGHLHLHMMPRILSIFVKSFTQYYNDVKNPPWVRSLRVPWRFIFKLIQLDLSSALKNLVLKTIYSLSVLSVRLGPIKLKGAVGIYSFKNPSTFCEIFTSFRRDDDIVFIVHPSISSSRGEWREAEYLILLQS